MDAEKVNCKTDMGMGFPSNDVDKHAKKSRAQLTEWFRLDAGKGLVVQETFRDQRASL